MSVLNDSGEAIDSQYVAIWEAQATVDSIDVAMAADD